MRIIFIGPPGAGKGTQAQRLAHCLGVPHISTGEVLRREIQSQSTLGRSVKNYIDQGQLVPDEVILDVVERRLNQSHCSAGFLLDGFPRTVTQAQRLQTYLENHRRRLDCAIEFQVESEEIVLRLSARGRADDKPEVIRQRLVAYHRETQPLVVYYRRRQLLHLLDGRGDVEDVSRRLLEAVNRLPKRCNANVARAH